MATRSNRSMSIQPLGGGYRGYIETLDNMRDSVEIGEIRTKEDLISWYMQEYDTSEGTARPYMNSLFRCGLLKQNNIGIECTFPKKKSKDQRIIEIIDNNIVFVLDMLYEACGGSSYEELHDIGKRKYELSAQSNVNQIWWRRGWLESAGMLELRDGLIQPTGTGLELLQEQGFDMPTLRGEAEGQVNPAEFGGKGEGMEHKTLKELVHEDCDRVLRTVRGRRVAVIDRRMEYDLRSGDRVDVTAWDQERVCWHIEVKSKVSGEADIERGLYQCVKYKAVAEAMEHVAPRRGRSVKSILIVESDLSTDLDDLAGKLQVGVHRISVEMQRKLDLRRRE